MSTAVLTGTVAVMLVGGLSWLAIMALWQRKLPEAALAAAGMCAAAHITLVSLAWEGAASTQWEEVMPAVSSLPTEAYDASAWAAIVLLAVAIVAAIVGEIRRRRHNETPTSPEGGAW